jgi:hypothetical protein
MAVGGDSHGMAPIVVGRRGAGPSLGAGPGIVSRRSDYRWSATSLLFASAPRGVAGQPRSFLRRSESLGLDINPARRENVLGNLPQFNYRRDTLIS